MIGEAGTELKCTSGSTTCTFTYRASITPTIVEPIGTVYPGYLAEAVATNTWYTPEADKYYVNFMKLGETTLELNTDLYGEGA